MKLEFENSVCQIYSGDCYEQLPVADKSIDLILTDPPYGLNYVSGRRFNQFGKIAGDKSFPYTLLSRVLREADRVLADTGAIYIFTRYTSYPALLNLLTDDYYNNALNLGVPIFYVKNNWSSGNLDSDWGSRVELIVYARRPGHRFIGARPTNALMFKRVGTLTHPCEKPTELLSYIISKSSPVDGTVLDMFMGSGATLEAAININRKAIGIDIDPMYVKTTIKRIKNMSVFAFPETEISDHNFTLETISLAGE